MGTTHHLESGEGLNTRAEWRAGGSTRFDPARLASDRRAGRAKAPLNVATAGQIVPFKWRLVDANGTPLTELSSVKISAVGISCSSGTTPDALEEYGAGASGLQNFGDGNYQFNWKSPKNYRNSCKKLLNDLGDGSTRFALFQFK